MQEKRLALLIEDSIVCKGVETIIQQSNFATLGLCTFANISEFLHSQSDVEILLFDISPLTLIEMEKALEQIQLSCKQTKIIVISPRLTMAHISQVMEFGVKGFIYREDLADSLLYSLDLVIRGVATMSTHAMELLATSNFLVYGNKIKPRQMSILRLTAQGMNPKEIARQLNVDVRTVQRDKQQLREILNVTTNDLLLDAAREQGILDDELPP